MTDWTKLVQTTFTLQSSRPSIVRRKLDLAGARDRSDKAPMAGEIPALSKDHRGLGVRSVIDMHLWNRARWTGTAFTRSGPHHPPALALLFRDAEAARKIFERWRERFGPVDEQNEIYVAVVRGISPKEPPTIA